MNDGSPSGQTLCGVPSGIFLFYSFILCLLSQRFCSQNCYTSYILSVIHMLCIFNVCIYIYVIHMYDINMIMYYASCIKCYTYVCILYIWYRLWATTPLFFFFSFLFFYSEQQHLIASLYNITRKHLEALHVFSRCTWYICINSFCRYMIHMYKCIL